MQCDMQHLSGWDLSVDPQVFHVCFVHDHDVLWVQNWPFGWKVRTQLHDKLEQMVQLLLGYLDNQLKSDVSAATEQFTDIYKRLKDLMLLQHCSCI